jgi:peptide deformylase
MRETMREAPRVGLAAPQVGEPLQLVVIEATSEFQQTLPQAILDERERPLSPST